VELALDAREFARWTISGKVLPSDPPQVTIGDSDWLDTTWSAAADLTNPEKPKRECRLLVAGPDADPEGAEVLEAGTHATRLKVTDNPEIIPRDTDEITVG